MAQFESVLKEHSFTVCRKTAIRAGLGKGATSLVPYLLRLPAAGGMLRSEKHLFRSLSAVPKSIVFSLRI